MKKLIKADLCDILRLVPTCQPVTSESIKSDIEKLRRCEHTDYLFLARREKSFLSDLPAVYEPGTYENLKWLYWQGITRLPVAALMFANSEFLVLLNQAATDRAELAKLLNISATQMSYITNAEAGHGPIRVSGSIVPFENEFPRTGDLYRLMTTDPQDK